jgi:hypothetical protein
VIVDGIEAAYRATGGSGIWVADREYDNKNVLDDLLGHRRLFVIRVKINPKVSRDIRDERGRTRRLSTVAWNTKMKYNLSDYGGSGKTKFGFSKPLTLPHRDEPVTLVVYIHVGAEGKHQEPVAVLTNVEVQGPEDAAWVVQEYMGRWGGCEDPIRFLKQTFRMEKFLIDGMPAIRAWFFFISVAFSILFEIESWGKILEWVVKLSQPFGKKVRFRYYRIIQGLKEFLYLSLPPYLPLSRSP